MKKWRQLKQSLQRKVDTLGTLDKDILGMTPNKVSKNEIQQSDIFAESTQLAVLKLTKVLEEIEGTSDNATEMASRRSTPSFTTHAHEWTPALGMAASSATATGFNTTRVTITQVLPLRKFDGMCQSGQVFGIPLNLQLNETPISQEYTSLTT